MSDTGFWLAGLEEPIVDGVFVRSHADVLIATRQHALSLAR